MAVAFSLNGRAVKLEVKPDTPLLYVLRNDEGINSARFGCGLGQCGACTVLIEGSPTRSCVLPLASVAGKNVTTLEGLGSESNPHPVQQAFIDEQAMQCGYCASGMILAASALLATDPSPDDTQIRHALRGHLCRCGTHTRILKAVHRAAERLRDSDEP